MNQTSFLDDRATRRLRVYSKRTARALAGMAPTRKCVFFHLPKCGGTSISEALCATIPLTQKIGSIDAVSSRRAAAMFNHGIDDPNLCHEDLALGHEVFQFREQLLLHHMARSASLIHGHILFSALAQKTFGHEYKFVTVMRDPEERLISNYRMARRTGTFAGDLDAYLESDLAVSHSRVFLRYFSGVNTSSGERIESDLETAISRISAFSIIGFMDDLAAFKKSYRALFSVTPSIGKRNAATISRPEITVRARERIKEICRFDQLIYQEAKNLQAVSGTRATQDRTVLPASSTGIAA